jgi:hypothetical protein
MTPADTAPAAQAPAAPAQDAANPLDGMSMHAIRKYLRQRAAASKSRDVRANPGNLHGTWKDTKEYISGARRFVKGAGARVEAMEIEGLADLAALAAEADEVFRQAGNRLHEKGYSWAEIGTALGYTTNPRPRAQQLFTRASASKAAQARAARAAANGS